MDRAGAPGREAERERRRHPVAADGRVRGDLRGPDAGRLPATHEALDAGPRRRAAGFLRHMLTAAGVLLPRDEELARTATGRRRRLAHYRARGLQVGDFLSWAARHGHCQAFTLPGRARASGAAHNALAVPRRPAGQPITAGRLAGRLRAHGIHAMAGRRAALTDLAAQLPAASSPTCCTSRRPRRSAGCARPEATGSGYAAELARTRHHQP